MKCLILAAGRGSRIVEEGESKPLIPPGREDLDHCPDSRGWITEAFSIRIDAPDYSCDVVPSGWVEDGR